MLSRTHDLTDLPWSIKDPELHSGIQHDWLGPRRVQDGCGAIERIPSIPLISALPYRP